MRRLRIFSCMVVVVVLAGTIGLGGCSEVAQDGAAPTSDKPSEEDQAASLSGSLLVASADKLSAGENAAPPSSPAGSTAMGSRLLSPATPESSVVDLIAGNWLFPDGSGGIYIDEEPSMTLFDADGDEVGPYPAEEGDGFLYVLLGEEEIAEVFGEDTGLENVSFAFIPSEESESELVMAITNEDTMDRQWFILVSESSGPEGPLPDNEDDETVMANVDLLAYACLYYAYIYGEMPSATDVAPDGAIGELLSEWPTNPYTGEPMEYVSREQKAGNYEVDTTPASISGMFAKKIHGYLGDETLYEVVVPYDQVGL